MEIMKRRAKRPMRDGKYVKVYKGKTFSLVVSGHGTLFHSKVHGKAYNSATDAAEAITKHPTSGPNFWGAREQDRLKRWLPSFRRRQAMAERRKDLRNAKRRKARMLALKRQVSVIGTKVETREAVAA